MDAISTAVAAFERDGYYVARSLFSTEEVRALVELIDHSLSPALAPVEFEADVHYPGAPTSKTAPGGNTPRRLLHAYGRDSLFQQVGRHPGVGHTQGADGNGCHLSVAKSSQLCHDQAPRIQQRYQLASGYSLLAL